jgi:hypothetical protein
MAVIFINAESLDFYVSKSQPEWEKSQYHSAVAHGSRVNNV